MAGFHVEGIINEPSAASFILSVPKPDGRMPSCWCLILEGNARNLVECFDNIVEILAVSGDNHLGGSDFDRLIADMFWKSRTF